MTLIAEINIYVGVYIYIYIVRIALSQTADHIRAWQSKL